MTEPLFKTYSNPETCKKCGGNCCKSLPGSYVPEDFNKKITVEFISELLLTGNFAIDWWDGDTRENDLSRVYYLRPRILGGALVDASWGGLCINWSQEKGCSLSERDRPFQCRMLVPGPGGNNCTFMPEDEADKRGCADRWYDYQNILEECVSIFYSEGYRVKFE